jgi:tetratricopeptide (TPR) repeat protein
MSGAVFRVAVGFITVAIMLLGMGIYLSDRYSTEQQQLAAAGNTEAALERLELAARLNPFSPNPYVYQFSIYQQQGQSEAALQALEAARERDPYNYSHYISQGNLQMGELNEPRAAIESFRRALELNPNSVPARYQLASAYLRVNDLESAREVYEGLRDVNRLSREGRFDLGRIYVRTGDPELGVATLEETRVRAERELERLEAGGADEAEITQLRQFVGSVELAIADGLVVQERYDEAREVILESEAEQAPAILQLLEADPEGYRETVLDSAVF